MAEKSAGKSASERMGYTAVSHVQTVCGSRKVSHLLGRYEYIKTYGNHSEWLSQKRLWEERVEELLAGVRAASVSWI